MFGFIKNLIGERGETSAPVPESKPEGTAAPAAKRTEPSGGEKAAVAESPPVPPPVPAHPAAEPAARARTERVLLPLKPITDRLPQPLQSLVAQPPGANVEIALPVEELLAKLSQGRVEVTVADLRKVAPVSTFGPDRSHDDETVEIPLKEVIARLDPALLRLRGQRRIELPGEIQSPFVQQGHQARQARQAGKPGTHEPAASASAGQPSAQMPGSQPPPSGESERDEREKLKKSGIVQASSEIQALFAGIKKEAPAPVPPPVAPPPSPVIPKPKPVPVAPQAKALNLMGAKPQGSSPAPAPAPAKRQPIVDAPAIKLKEAPPAAPGFPGPAKPGAPALPGVIALPLAKLRDAWPEAIREEVAACPPDARVDFPAAELATALRQGKVSVPWQRLRGMIMPKMAAAGESLYDEALLELPLPVVAPLFMAATQRHSPQQRVSVDENLPALFSPAKPAEKPTLKPTSKPVEKQPEKPAEPAEPAEKAPSQSPSPASPIPVPLPAALEPAAEAKEAETAPPSAAFTATPAANVPVPEQAAPAGPSAPVSAPAPATPPKPADSGAQPGALGLDDRVPSELVARACTLGGVAGAVVALHDGLLVAAKVPDEFKAETIAAFLPQVFSRLEQAAGTMQIGELQTLMFTAGNRPWQIWRAGSLFFAAVGRPNELLPGAQLKIIAAQLARQVKI